jgi:two-component system sensor histidine kinase KdpD
MHLHRQWTQIDEIITMALKRAEPRTQTHQMEVWIEDELPSIKVDEQAIAEVIYTLVDNAAKYSPAGSPIRIRAIPRDGNTLLLSVEDRGPGLRAEIRERVFEKFFRAMRDGDAGDRRLSGTGMGLAIARGIVEAHGGKIWIEDASDGPGAKFVVSLPTTEDGSPESFNQQNL